MEAEVRNPKTLADLIAGDQFIEDDLENGMKGRVVTGVSPRFVVSGMSKFQKSTGSKQGRATCRAYTVAQWHERAGKRDPKLRLRHLGVRVPSDATAEQLARLADACEEILAPRPAPPTSAA